MLRRHWHWYFTAIVCSAAFILLAIVPWRGFDPTGHWHRVGWIPFVSRPVKVIDFVGNFALFVPLGVSIALHAQRPALARTAAAAFACSLLASGPRFTAGIATRRRETWFSTC